MKKILALILALLTLVVCLTSCGKMEDFTKKLGSDYEVDTFTQKEIEYISEIFELDSKEYEVEEMIQATHEDTGCSVFIIKCGSAGKAKKLVENSGNIIKYLKYYYSSSYTFDSVRKGKFVLIGETSAINDALGK